MPGEHPLETDQPTPAVGHVDLGHVAGHDDPRAEPDPGEEHLHLLRCRVLRLVEDDEAVVQRATAHERQRGHFDGLAFEQPLRRLELHHVVQRVVQRAQVRVDLRHQVARQEPEPLPGFHGWAGQDDPLHFLGLQRPHRHRDSEPGLARTGRPDAERDHVLGDGVDVPLLSGRLRTDRTTLRAAQHVLREDLARPLVLVDHADDAPQARLVELVTALEQTDQLLEQLGDATGLLAAHDDLVAAHVDVRRREGRLDLTQVLIARTDQRRHEVRAGDDDRGRGLGRCHAVVRTGQPSAVTITMVAAGPVRELNKAQERGPSAR